MRAVPVAWMVIMFFSVPVGFFVVYAIGVWWEKPIEDHDAYAHVLRAHRAACETLGASSRRPRSTSNSSPSATTSS